MKECSLALLKSIETADLLPLAYIQPTTQLPIGSDRKNGRVGFHEFLGQGTKQGAKVRTVRCIQDGNFVVTHSEYLLNESKIGFDVFRFENGKIVEHWDNRQIKSGPNPSGHSMIDGATEVRDLEKTQANKTLVRAFVEDFLVKGKVGNLCDYFDGDRYVQHNPLIPDRVSRLKKALGWLVRMSKFGVPLLKYTDIKGVFGEGNFVLVVSEGRLAFRRFVFYDLFRVEGSKIAEHWDVIEPLKRKTH